MKKVYIIYGLITGLMLFLIPIKVNAAGYSSGYVYVSGVRITTNGYSSLTGGINRDIHVYALADGWTPGLNRTVYVNVKFCLDTKISANYVHSNSTNSTFDVVVYNRSTRCMYNGSTYTGGRLVDVYFRTTSLGNVSGSFDSTIVGYFDAYMSIQLISLNVSEEPFDQDNASDTIIQQNDETISEIKKSNGLLSNIWNGITSVVSGIANLPGLIWNAIKGGFEAISNALVTLGNFLLDGIKGLFIPEDMKFLDDFMNTLNTKLGFIGAIPSKLIQFVLDLANADVSEINSLHLPSISIFGNDWWGTQEIDLTVAKQIFQPIKYLTDLVCVYITSRTLLRWWENFTGGNSK